MTTVNKTNSIEDSTSTIDSPTKDSSFPPGLSPHLCTKTPDFLESAKLVIPKGAYYNDVIRYSWGNGKDDYIFHKTYRRRTSRTVAHAELCLGKVDVLGKDWKKVVEGSYEVVLRYKKSENTYRVLRAKECKLDISFGEIRAFLHGIREEEREESFEGLWMLLISGMLSPECAAYLENALRRDWVDRKVRMREYLKEFDTRLVDYICESRGHHAACMELREGHIPEGKTLVFGTNRIWTYKGELDERSRRELRERAEKLAEIEEHARGKIVWERNVDMSKELEGTFGMVKVVSE